MLCLRLCAAGIPFTHASLAAAALAGLGALLGPLQQTPCQIDLEVSQLTSSKGGHLPTGILFTRVSLDAAPGVAAAALADLDALLARSSAGRASDAHHGAAKRSDAALLQLAAAAAFAGDHASWAPEGQRPGCAGPGWQVSSVPAHEKRRARGAQVRVHDSIMLSAL